jgi:hypothetical protein
VTNVSVGSFARLCQATNLLTLVLRHVNDNGCGSNCLVEESEQLIKAILALFRVIRNRNEGKNEVQRVCVALAVCYKYVLAKSSLDFGIPTRLPS